jgi:hypothetical protein
MGKGLPRSLQRGYAAANLGSGAVTQETVAVDLTVDVSATGANKGFAGVAIPGLTLAEGNILLLGTVATLSFESLDANAIDAWQGDFALGTVATVDADTADDGEDDVLDLQALAATGGTEATTKYDYVPLEANSLIDLTAGSASVNLNILLDAASITDDTTAQIRVVGSISVAYTVLGDH